ncbi:serpin family protein [Streptomyces olivochromogenes]|uniref:serpin family protein n=1 Tax=Streptomyces olivochromogenes TaxID=1963 RepID=UPI003680D37A
MRITNATIDAVNGLTSRWAREAPAGTVFSAAGVWPLLGFLADGATGAARAELAAAVGFPADEAAYRAREFVAALDAIRGLDSAIGLWNDRKLAVRETWAAGLPDGTRGELTGDPATDHATLDAWAARRTGGLIERMPVALSEETVLVLASALALRTQWLRPFEEYPLLPETGPWQERTLLGLQRSSTLLDRIGVADTPEGCVTELKVLGTHGIDVHLLLGEERMSPGQVLGAGMDILARTRSVVPGPQLPYGDVGPGLHVAKERCERPQPPTLHVTTVAYELTADHDLLERHGLFGLTTAKDPSRGHFPGIGDRPPLAVASARQSAMAKFGALGFRAAAVTTFGFAGVGIPDLRYVTTTVDATFDRPFGFLALHRTSRLVLAAGWVTDPEPFPEDADAHA